MISPLFLAALYLIAAALVITAGHSDFQWVWPARVFLALSLAGMATFNALIRIDLLDFQAMRSLSRWLQLPLVIAIMLLSAARIYSVHSERR